MSRSEAKVGMDKVIPILKKYEFQLKDLNKDMVKLVSDFNNSFLDSWTGELQDRLMSFDVTMKEKSSVEGIVRNWNKDAETA